MKGDVSSACWGSRCFIIVMAILFVGCLVPPTAATRSVDEERAMKNLIIHADSVKADEAAAPVSEQQRIDGIKSAFMKLPSEELARLGVDMNQDYVAGTKFATQLENAWSRRQAELKDLMEKQLDSAEYMKNISETLQDLQVSDEEILLNLKELEQLLSDIDNARDFHTIGGWPILTSLLPGLTTRPKNIQSEAIHCIGTAVKNDYDFQLWVLENAGGNMEGQPVMHWLLSALNLHMENELSAKLTDDQLRHEVDELQRRALYAISSATRGNLDVQAYMLQSAQNLNEKLKAFVKDNFFSIALRRKAWHLVADLLDEMVYLRNDLKKEISIMKQNNDSRLPDDIDKVLENLRPLGATFISEDVDWLLLAETTAAEIASKCTQDGLGLQRDISFTSELAQTCPQYTPPPVRDIFLHAVKVKDILSDEYKVKPHNSTQMESVLEIRNHFDQFVNAFKRHNLLVDQLY